MTNPTAQNITADYARGIIADCYANAKRLSTDEVQAVLADALHAASVRNGQQDDPYTLEQVRFWEDSPLDAVAFLTEIVCALPLQTAERLPFDHPGRVELGFFTTSVHGMERDVAVFRPVSLHRNVMEVVAWSEVVADDVWARKSFSRAEVLRVAREVMVSVGRLFSEEG